MVTGDLENLLGEENPNGTSQKQSAVGSRVEVEKNTETQREFSLFV